jgi:hypothetical protein
VRALKLAFVLLLGVLLQGCSATRLAYNNADVFLRWQANNYFDFEGEASEELDQRIAALLRWHRAEALPRYAAFAEQVAQRLERGGLRREDLDWGYDAFRVQVGEALGAASAEAAPLLDRLSVAQIDHLERRLADDNRKFAKEQLQGTVDERRKRRLKRNLERLEEWFGSLSEPQAERVRRYSDSAPLAGELRDRDRRRRQAEFVSLLRARAAKERLAAWAKAWEADREPAYARAQQATREHFYALLLDLDRTLSREQRAHVARHVRRYGELFASLNRQ